MVIMVLNIRNAEADHLARKLSAVEGKEITQVVIIALKEALDKRMREETSRQSVIRLLNQHGIIFHENMSQKLDDHVYHELDGDGI
jgi:antitoxin VapB